MRIFQSIEDFLATERYNVVDQYVWINSFLMWMQSPILQNYWPILSFNYSARAREVTEKLIRNAQDLSALRKQKGKLEAADYDAVSKKFDIPMYIVKSAIRREDDLEEGKSYFFAEIETLFNFIKLSEEKDFERIKRTLYQDVYNAKDLL